MMQKYLPSVIKHSVLEENTEGNVEVIIADNASTDDSIEMLRRKFPSVRIITLDKNWGFAEGYNKSFKILDKENKEQGKPLPEYYLLLNSDVRVGKGWLTPMLQYMQEHQDVAACQPKLLSDVSPTRFEYAGASGGYIDRYGYPYCRGRIFETIEEDRGQYDEPLNVLWATGACLLIRREDYWKAGGLDGRFFAHNEEIDLCWRLNLMGRKVACVPQSTAFHYGGGTLPKGNPRKTYLNFRNNLTMLYKNLPEKELRSVMRMRLLLDYIAAFKMLILSGSYGEFKAVIKARHDFHAWRKDFDADRQHIQQTALASHPTGKTNLSILWQYYVKGKKLFSHL